jgi:hypothetical protein
MLLSNGARKVGADGSVSYETSDTYRAAEAKLLAR